MNFYYFRNIYLENHNAMNSFLLASNFSIIFRVVMPEILDRAQANDVQNQNNSRRSINHRLANSDEISRSLCGFPSETLHVKYPFRPSKIRMAFTRSFSCDVLEASKHAL